MSQQQVQISLDGDQLRLASPYNPDLAPQAKKIGGRWDPDTKSWRFDARDEARVRDLAREVYGTDGTEDPSDVVTVRVDASEYGGYATVTVAGRIVAERRHRDQPVRLAPGVVIVEGSFRNRGGSMRYPELGENQVVLEVRDLPRAAAERDGLEIVSADDDRKAVLLAERDRITARLADIEEELADIK